MHAFLITGATQEKRLADITKRLAEYKISQWDTIRLPDQPGIGIGDIRDFQRALNLTPQNSPAKAGVLTTIDRLTPEAQNALLKTLEEPPPKTYLLAETEHPELLLPTILSRFSLVNLGATISKAVDEKITAEFIEKIVNSSPGKKIQMIDSFLATHDDAETFVSSLLTVAQKELLHHPSKKLVVLIKNLLTARSQLSVNVNPRLVVDNAVLTL
jgi:DNA polymerase III gamma/tau subunit